MTAQEIISKIAEAYEDYEYVGIRFEDKAREVGEPVDNSRDNLDRDDEREFPAYGTDEYNELPELDGACAYRVANRYGEVTCKDALRTAERRESLQNRKKVL